MGKGSKSTREMNSLVKVLKRNRKLKTTARTSYARPTVGPNGQIIPAEVEEKSAE